MLSDDYSACLKIENVEIERKNILDFKEHYLSEADHKLISNFRRASVNQSHLLSQINLNMAQNSQATIATGNISLLPLPENAVQLKSNLKSSKNFM